MKILLYSQHVLGVGHFFRSLEICRALDNHEVLLVSGGPPVAAKIPAHVREVRLPELKMDTQFENLHSSRPGQTLEQIRQLRQTRLWELAENERPEILMTELYPFGRKAFRFELDPVLSAIRAGRLPHCQVISSVRDILVEKENSVKHERRVVNTLNSSFDAVLIHGDPDVIRLGRTFERFDEIRIPVIYTGYIAPKPPANARSLLRSRLGLSKGQKLVVASAGGGSVGYGLLEAVLKSYTILAADPDLHLIVFTGPFMAGAERRQLQSLAPARAVVKAFSAKFLSHLAAADLSISMGGYNTTMNILSTGVTALVYPFGQNHEQRLRAQCLAERGALKVLDEIDLVPERLAQQMRAALTDKGCSSFAIKLDGADRTARWLERWIDGYDPVR